MYRLLIADDERLEREALRYIVQKGSLAIDEILEAANGREAVARAGEASPDICFLDIKMPGLSGIEAARRIKADRPATRLVFLTAFDSFDYAQEAIRIGVEGFIIKPATDGEVMKLLQRIVGALDRDRSARSRTERTEARLELAIASLAAELEAGLAHGTLAPGKLTEYLELCGLTGEIVVADCRLDFSSYPMQIQGEAQREILATRCRRFLQSALRARGVAALWASTGGRLRSLCVLPPGIEAAALFVELRVGLRRELGIAARIVVSRTTDDPAAAAGLVDGTTHPPATRPGGLAAGSGPATPLPRPVQRARDYIDAHLAEGLSLSTVSDEIRYSRYHLSRLFKRATGTNLLEYITASRIARARKLLESGELSVKEVSQSVGFTDPAYFARVFRRTEGVSPSRYRGSRAAGWREPASSGGA